MHKTGRASSTPPTQKNLSIYYVYWTKQVSKSGWKSRTWTSGVDCLRSVTLTYFTLIHKWFVPMVFLIDIVEGKGPAQSLLLGALFNADTYFSYIYTESIEWLIEEKAFSGSYDLPLPPPPRQQVVSLCHVCRWSSLLTGQGEVLGRRKPDPL